jgi:hypothetical protein
VTCYYYRRSYYRAFFWSPPACTIPDARAKYSGETKFPFILQNIHRYALYLAIVVLAILWWDAILASTSTVTSGSARDRDHGGERAPPLWVHVRVSRRSLSRGWIPRLVPRQVAAVPAVGDRDEAERRHSRWAWFSLFGVALTDLYIRLNAMGVIVDPRIVF